MQIKSLHRPKQLHQSATIIQKLHPQKTHPMFHKIKYMCRCRPNTKIPKNLTAFRVSNLGIKVED